MNKAKNKPYAPTISGCSLTWSKPNHLSNSSLLNHPLHLLFFLTSPYFSALTLSVFLTPPPLCSPSLLGDTGMVDGGCIISAEYIILFFSPLIPRPWKKKKNFYHLKGKDMKMRALSICKPFAKPHLLFVIYLHAVCVLEQMAIVLWYCCFRVNGKTERRLMYARTWMHSSILNTCSLRGKVFFDMLFSPRDYHPFFHTLHVSPPASSNLYLSYMYTPHTYRCYRTLATFTIPRCGQD